MKDKYVARYFPEEVTEEGQENIIITTP